MIQLEKYHGTRTRHTCPACNSKGEFARFVGTDGNYIADNVGICNRISKCGYHYKPKQYFADNPNSLKFVKVRANKSESIKTRNPHLETKSFDVIPLDQFKPTLANYEQNAFVQFLFDLFPYCSEEIQNVLKMYFVGTYRDYRGNYTCFPSIDRLNRICRAKLIRFNRETGKRLKGEYDKPSSLVRKLKLKEDFQYKQIFFGEHLLSRELNKPVAVVEAEKTAIVASLCMSQFVWLATGSKQWLKAERLQRLGQRQIILYPDADGFELWQGIATDAARQGLNVKVASLIENFATDEQRQNQYDLADYLIEQQTEINEINEFIDRYNAKLETVLNDESLFNDFNLILDEQKAIAIYSGGLSDTQAERICTQPQNLQNVILSV